MPDSTPENNVPSAPANASANARASTLVIALALALLLGIQPLTTDLYLPAFPALTRDLAAPMATAQLTLSALILAFGLGQLIWGPVADRWGRRPVLLLGLAGYVAASVASALASSIEVLVLTRISQGLTMAAAVVVARAMVRDLFQPSEGMRVMSLGMSGLGLIAMASPLLGGGLVSHGGWRAPFWCVALVGAAVWLFVWRALPESLPRANPLALRPALMVATWRRIIVNPTFLAWAGLSTCTYGGLFVFLAGSSFVYMDVLGLSAGQYGLALCSSSVSYLLGTVWCRRWLLRHGSAGAVKRAAAFTLVGGLSMAALALAGVQTVWAILLPQLAYTFGHGIHQSCGQAGAVGPFPQEAGAASALSGFLLALTAFGVGRWLGVALDGTTLPLALGIATGAIATTTVAWTLVQRHGQPAAGARHG